MSSSPPPAHTDWHTLEIFEVLEQLSIEPTRGLSAEETARRQARYGPNELIKDRPHGRASIFIHQAMNPRNWLLLIAAGLSLLSAHQIEAAALFLFMLVGLLLDAVQEDPAEQALGALNRILASTARTRRNSSEQEVLTRSLVPGDVILLETGSIVPADARLIESANLRVQEGILTGNDQPVAKTPQALREQNLPLTSRRNLVYMGSAVTEGRGQAVVIQTGMQTELGNIARQLYEGEGGRSSFQRRYHQLSTILAVIAGGGFLIGVTAGWLRGEPISSLSRWGAALIATLPESLPIVSAFLLATSARRLLKQNARVRSLPTVEVLSTVTVICSDQAGPLTQNELKVTLIDANEHTLQVNVPIRGAHALLTDQAEPISSAWSSHTLILACAAMTNEASLERDPENQADFLASGPAAEGAPLIAAARMGLWKPRLDRLFPRVVIAPATLERPRTSTLFEARLTPHLSQPELPLVSLFSSRHAYLVCARGEISSMLEASDRVLINGQAQPLTEAGRARLQGLANQLLQEGMHVQALALRPMQLIPAFPVPIRWPHQELPSFLRELARAPLDIPRLDQAGEALERELVLVGLIGVAALPREEVRQMVHTCQAAGIRTVMMTADPPASALQAARLLHLIADQPARVLTGSELDRMSRGEIETAVSDVSIFAEISPQHRLAILQAFQSQGQVVAMTGEAIHDAPALRQSEIGAAMGTTGSEVARAAARIILLNDRFTTLVSAIEEGRRAAQNMRRAIRFLLSVSAAQFLLLLTAILSGLPQPLSTLQILWINLVAAGLPAAALAIAGNHPHLMHRPPDRANETWLAHGFGEQALLQGALAAAGCLVVAAWAWLHTDPNWNTVLVTQLGLLMIATALADIGMHGLHRHRPWVLGLIFLAAVFQVAAILWKPLQGLLGLSTPGWENVFAAFLVSLAWYGVCRRANAPLASRNENRPPLSKM